MATPITWRNVEGPSAAQALRPMESAGNTINSAFDIFSKLVQQRQAVDQNNFMATDEAGKQAVLDRLQQAKTPEEVAAAQADVDRMTQGLTTATRAALRGATEARVTGTRQNILAANTYGDATLDREQLPIKEQIAALTANGDFTKARELITNTPNLRGLGALSNGITIAERVAQDRATALATGADATTLRKLNITKTQAEIDALARTTAEAEQARKLQARLAQEQTDLTATQEATGSMHQQVAKRLGLTPVDARGFPDFANMRPEEITAFDALAKSMGIPDSSVATGGDTKRLAAFNRKLLSEGFSPTVVSSNAESIKRIYQPTTAPVGNDAFNVALAGAQNQAGFDRVDANNWYAPGSPDARKAYEEVALKIPDLVKGSSNGLAPAEDVEDVQRLLGEVSTVGIKRKDGTYVIPSVNDFMRFVRSSEGGWFRDAKRAENIRKDLETWANTPEALKMAEDGAKSQVYRDKQKVIQILRETLNPQKK